MKIVNTGDANLMIVSYADSILAINQFRYVVTGIYELKDSSKKDEDVYTIIINGEEVKVVDLDASFIKNKDNTLNITEGNKFKGVFINPSRPYEELTYVDKNRMYLEEGKYNIMYYNLNSYTMVATFVLLTYDGTFVTSMPLCPCTGRWVATHEDNIMDLSANNKIELNVKMEEDNMASILIGKDVVGLDENNNILVIPIGRYEITEENNYKKIIVNVKTGSKYTLLEKFTNKKLSIRQPIRGQMLCPSEIAIHGIYENDIIKVGLYDILLMTEEKILIRKQLHAGPECIYLIRNSEENRSNFAIINYDVNKETETPTYKNSPEELKENEDMKKIEKLITNKLVLEGVTHTMSICNIDGEKWIVARTDGNITLLSKMTEELQRSYTEALETIIMVGARLIIS